MNQEKNKNAGITLLIIIIIALLVLIALLMTGTIDLKLTKQEPNCPETATKAENLIDKLIGTYSYKGEYVETAKTSGGSKTINEDKDAWAKGKLAYESLTLKASGLAEVGAGNMNASGYEANGKWYISNNEIIVINDECKPIVVGKEADYPNCSPVWIYKYSIDNNSISITSDNNTVTTVTLTKENK